MQDSHAHWWGFTGLIERPGIGFSGHSDDQMQQL